MQSFGASLRIDFAKKANEKLQYYQYIKISSVSHQHKMAKWEREREREENLHHSSCIQSFKLIESEY